MSKATYNITNDKIKFYPEEIGRLPADRYKEARTLGFLFWHGSKCFAAKWSPGAEDFVKSYDLTIEEDDTPDDLDSRVARYEKYADKAEQEAEQAAERAMVANTERRVRMAESSTETNIDKAAHWHSRIAGAIRWAAHKDDPSVIVRRIEGLEKDLRRQEQYWKPKAAYKNSDGSVSLYFSNGGRGGQMIHTEELNNTQVYAKRWIDHIQARLEYERAYLEAVGGDPRKAVEGLNIGDVVLYGNEECTVLRVGPKNVVIKTNYGGRRVGREDLDGIVSRAEVPGKKIIRKNAIPQDGIKKGSLVTWTKYDWQTRQDVPFTSKVVSVGALNLKVETPDHPLYENYTYHNLKALPLRRKDVKLAEVNS